MYGIGMRRWVVRSAGLRSGCVRQKRVGIGLDFCDLSAIIRILVAVVVAVLSSRDMSLG